MLLTKIHTKGGIKKLCSNRPTECNFCRSGIFLSLAHVLYTPCMYLHVTVYVGIPVALFLRCNLSSRFQASACTLVPHHSEKEWRHPHLRMRKNERCGISFFKFESKFFNKKIFRTDRMEMFRHCPPETIFCHIKHLIVTLLLYSKDFLTLASKQFA